MTPEDMAMGLYYGLKNSQQRVHLILGPEEFIRGVSNAIRVAVDQELSELLADLKKSGGGTEEACRLIRSKLYGSGATSPTGHGPTPPSSPESSSPAPGTGGPPSSPSSPP